MGGHSQGVSCARPEVADQEETSRQTRLHIVGHQVPLRVAGRLVFHHKGGDRTTPGVPACQAETNPRGVRHQEIGRRRRCWRLAPGLGGQHLRAVGLAKVVDGDEVEGVGRAALEAHCRGGAGACRQLEIIGCNFERLSRLK